MGRQEHIRSNFAICLLCMQSKHTSQVICNANFSFGKSGTSCCLVKAYKWFGVHLVAARSNIAHNNEAWISPRAFLPKRHTLAMKRWSVMQICNISTYCRSKRAPILKWTPYFQGSNSFQPVAYYKRDNKFIYTSILIFLAQSRIQASSTSKNTASSPMRLMYSRLG